MSTKPDPELGCGIMAIGLSAGVVTAIILFLVWLLVVR
jgi:hypothetical protein